MRIGAVLGSVLLAQAAWLLPAEEGATAAQTKDTAATPLVTVTVDTSKVPEAAEWAAKAKEIVEKNYPLMVEKLKVDGVKPPATIKLIFENKGKGIAGTAGNTVHIEYSWISKHPDDFGMVIHEVTHSIQGYPKYDPPWLVEGIADYIRFWMFEPENKRPRVNPDRAKYTDSYQTTAAFLAWVTATYDKDLITKLNAALRQNKYKKELFAEYTGKDLDTLWGGFTESLRKKRP